MQQPNLIIIAGCNGAGKSTYSESYVKGLIPFDFDKKFIENYSSLKDSELRDVIANNMTSEQYINSIESAFIAKESFCYETNFNNQPLIWATKAKKLGYRIELLFFCLDNIESAKKRVQYRTENKGHFVPEHIILERWKEGYKNLNRHFSFFDYILLIDNSSEESTPIALFELEKNESKKFIFRLFSDKIPEYSKRRFPKIFNLLKDENGQN